MATYAIGDVQGCYPALQKLLEQIQFDCKKDTLWFTGDLVNRGPQSLETLRFIKNLGTQQRVVLGNHDIHLLAVANGARAAISGDTLQPILTAPDRDELLTWLSQQPLLHHDDKLGFTMVHAGIAPEWDLNIAKQLAQEVEIILQDKNNTANYSQLFGDHPDQWHADLTGFDRLRCIINYFTRMRFCHPDGRLELKTKNTFTQNIHLVPWFKVNTRINYDLKIIFGHWAALRGITHTPHVYALDTGCSWGFELSAMRLDDGKIFNVSCTI